MNDSRKPDARVLVCLALASLLVSVLVVLWTGLRTGHDSFRYTNDAEDLLHGRAFRLPMMSQYLGYVGLVALSMVTGTGAPGVIAVQIAAAALATLALFDLGRQLSDGGLHHRRRHRALACVHPQRFALYLLGHDRHLARPSRGRTRLGCNGGGGARRSRSRLDPPQRSQTSANARALSHPGGGFYPLTVVGFVRERRRALALWMLAVIAGHLAVVALTFADPDGRYLLYVFPLILVFAGGGASALLACFGGFKARALVASF